MASFDPSFPHTLAAESFQRLRNSLEQLHLSPDVPSSNRLVVTETALRDGADLGHIDYFTLVISPSFAVLLIAQRRPPQDSPDPPASHYYYQPNSAAVEEQQLRYGVNLMASSTAVAQFLDWLMQQAPSINSGPLKAARQTLSADHSDIDQRCAALLLETLPKLSCPHSAIPAPPLGLPSAAPPKVAEVTVGGYGDHFGFPRNRAFHEPASLGLNSQDHAEAEDRKIERSKIKPDKVENTKNVFLAMVNHELRTPLTYILGMSTTLLRWIDSGASVALQRQQRHYLESIYNQGKHLLDLINSILDLSQSELGQIVPNVQPVALSKLVQQCIRAYQAEAHHRGINLAFEAHVHPAQDRIAADPLRLQQIVANLLSNAIKFTLPGGQVTVRLALTDSEAVIEVQDTGIGIAEHHQAMIFQKFKQVDESYRRQYAGIGTGLALAKQLTELHQGQIQVHSTPGVGTTFTVRLPYTACMTAPIPEMPAPRSRDFGERVLLVDGDGETAEAIADGVLTAGYPLLWMLHPPDSVQAILQLQPTCLIIGNLADRDGRSLIHQLRQHPDGGELRILVVDDGRDSASEAPHRYDALGVAAVLSEPIDLTALLDHLWGNL